MNRPPHPLEALDQFDITRLQGQLRAAKATWIVLFVGLVLGFSLSPSLLGTLLLAGSLVLWIWANWNTARSNAHIRQASLAAGNGEWQAAAGPLLAALQTFTLSRTGRLHIYQQLAQMRAAMGRYDQASALTWALLERHARSSNRRGQLWLLEAECRLRLGDVRATFEALTQAHRHRLRAAEALQLVAVQINYEAATGQTERLLEGLAAKLALVRLMPPQRGAEILAHLAEAAQAKEAATVAADLRRHALLLGAAPAHSAGTEEATT